MMLNLDRWYVRFIVLQKKLSTGPIHAPMKCPYRLKGDRGHTRAHIDHRQGRRSRMVPTHNYHRMCRGNELGSSTSSCSSSAQTIGLGRTFGATSPAAEPTCCWTMAESDVAKCSGSCCCCSSSCLSKVRWSWGCMYADSGMEAAGGRRMGPRVVGPWPC